MPPTTTCSSPVAPGILAALLCVGVAGCGTEGPVAEDPGWQGTIETEGDVTTVRNISGSVWGGDATLVEELSIDVDLGDEPYMFGAVGGIWGTEDRIYVADYRVPAVRVYDQAGQHLMDIGGEGQGPGEYQMPNSVVMSTAGELYVKDSVMGGRVNVYDADGTSLRTLIGDTSLSSALPMVATRDGSVFTDGLLREDDGDDYTSGMGIPGRDGFEGDMRIVPSLDFEFVGVRVNERARLNVPFTPRRSWAMSPTGAIVVGITETYRFEIHAADGHRTVVEKDADALPVDPEEAEWRRLSVIRSGRNFQEGWQWDGAEIPDTKPVWSGLEVDADGRIWVRRPGPTRRIEDCDPDPLEVTSGRPRSCWQSDSFYDVFGEDGRFLGAVSLPVPGLSLGSAFISGTTVIAPYEDDAGTGMVKRYRLVLPEGGGS